MATPAAILGAALILVATLLFLFRWDIQATSTTSVARLDRWSGDVRLCFAGPEAALTRKTTRVECEMD